MFKSLLIAAVLIEYHTVFAWFRMPCGKPLIHERADPIVSPGAVSGHVHQILGGNAFDLAMTFETTQTASCSTCKARKDKSNYWTPTLWYQSQNGSYHPVSQVGGGTVYYLFRRGTPDEVLHPFPSGFRMIAGNPFLRSYDSTSLEQRAVSFVCLDYTPGAPAAPQQPSIFNNNCLSGLRSQVIFPSCWDGQNVDSSDHKSHVAYPDQVDSGNCPPSHPIRLVTLFYEIIWDTNAWSDKWWKADGSHPFVFAMGDPTGYGFHGDFLNGWEHGALQRAIDGCTQDSGIIEQCGGALELFSDDEMRSCSLPSLRKQEAINGWLSALPGCNPVQPGPETVKPASCGGNQTPDPTGGDAGTPNDASTPNGPGGANDPGNPNEDPQVPAASTTTAPPPSITCASSLRGRSRDAFLGGLQARKITPPSLRHNSPHLILHKKATRRIRERS